MPGASMPCSLGNTHSATEKYRLAAGRTRTRRDSRDLFRIVRRASYVSPAVYSENRTVGGSSTKTSSNLSGVSESACLGLGTKFARALMRRSTRSSTSRLEGPISLARSAARARAARVFRAHSSSVIASPESLLRNGGTVSRSRSARAAALFSALFVDAAYEGSAVSAIVSTSSDGRFVPEGTTERASSRNVCDELPAGAFSRTFRRAARRASFVAMSVLASIRSCSLTSDASRRNVGAARGAPVSRWRTVYMASATSSARSSAAAASASAASRCVSAASRRSSREAA